MASITPGRRSATRLDFLPGHFDQPPPGFDTTAHPIISLHFFGVRAHDSRSPHGKKTLALPPGPGELAAARCKWWMRARAEGLAPVPGLIDIPGGRP